MLLAFSVGERVNIKYIVGMVLEVSDFIFVQLCKCLKVLIEYFYNI